MRTIKTAIAVMISIIVSMRLNVNYPLFVTIGAIVSMQSSLNESFQSGLNRILGTIVGAVIGIIFFNISPNNIVLTGLGIILLITINNKMNWSKSLVISLIVFSSIMMSYGQDVVLNSALRVIDTTLGIIIAFVINTVISPPKHEEKIYINAVELIDSAYLEFKSYLLSDTELNVKDIQEKLEALSQLFDIYKSEFIQNEKKILVEKDVMRILFLMDEVAHNFSIINSMKKEISSKNALGIYNKLNIKVNESPENDTEDFLVYNYHIKIITNDISKMKKLEIYRYS
ncbi:FUSC family protein [Acetoanaerobium pronyense]|nr:aromatic acid exporter family protein [Acetoanaerobium pronyense]